MALFLQKKLFHFAGRMLENDEDALDITNAELGHDLFDALTSRRQQLDFLERDYQ